MPRYSSFGRRQSRPPGLWHSIPAGIRGAIFSYGLLLVGFFTYRIALSVFGATGLTPSLIGYVVQLCVIYVVNGILAGWQADETRALQVRRVGFRGETVKLNLANYVGNGALAGLVLGLLMIITYFLAWQVVEQINPGIQLFEMISVSDSPGLFMLIDTLGAIAFGMVGGAIYDRIFAAPGRR